MQEAMEDDDGLAVIGVFLAHGNNGHAMHSVERATAHVQHEGQLKRLPVTSTDSLETLNVHKRFAIIYALIRFVKPTL